MLKLVSVLAILLTVGVGNAWGAADYIIPKLYLSSRNTVSGGTGWSFTSAACNNAGTDYWKMVSSSSVVTSPAFDISGYTNVTVSIKWGSFGSFNKTKCNATVKISTGAGTWATLGKTGLTSASTSGTVYNFENVEESSSYSSAQIQISTPSADGNVGGRLFYVEIKGEAAGSCDASPTVGNAAYNGALVYSTTPMTVPITCPSIGAGSSCEIKDYGFVWKAGGNPTISNNKTQIGTDNHSTAFNGNISGTFAAGTTYYVKAYAINNGDNTTLSSSAYSFTPRSITFNSNGGSSVSTILVISGKAASQPADPTKDGYIFGGWYTDSGLGTAVNWSSTITSNKTYYAKWIAEPTITISETSRAFGDRKVNGGPYTMTFNVSGANLTNNISLSISGTNAGMFSVTPSSLTQSAGSVSSTEITVSYSPTSAGSHSATINITSSGATSKTVALSGTGKWEVTWSNNGATSTTLVENSTKPTFPSTPSSCDATSTTFIGWATAEWDGKIASLAGKTVHTSNSTMSNITANGTTFYAVFAKQSGSGDPTWVQTTSVAVDDVVVIAEIDHKADGKTGKELAGWGGSTYGTGADYTTTPAGTITWTVVTGYNSTGVAFKNSSNKYLYWSSSNSLDVNSTLSANSSWSVSTESSRAKIQNNSTTTRVICWNEANPRFAAYDSKSHGDATSSGASTKFYYPVFYKQTPGYTYSDYLTTCCTALGSINGSVSWSNAATAVVTWDNIDHVSSWTVKYKTHAAGAYTTWAGDQSTAAGRRSVTISGLTPCTNYDFQIIANPASGYCEKDQTIEDSQTHNWTVTSTGVTHATASPAIPSTTCSGFSTTISPATGYALPAEITVTNATKSWNSSTGALSISSVTGNVSITITPTCVSPVISGDPADASYYVGDSPDALSVSATLASGTLTYLWKVSTNGGSTWSDATGINNDATYSGASLSTASVGTLKFKCIVGNSQGGCTVESGVATITVANASYFPNGKTIFIQAESTSAWTGGGCVKAWFHTAGGSETAQSTYWLFDATGGDAGKKLFATVVPATGDLPYLDIQRFAANCSDWWNKNGGCSYSDANGSNTIRSTGKHDDSSDGDYIRWNVSGVTIDLYGDPSDDDWASSLASFSDDGAGVWTATYNNYAPADAAGESQDFKAKTNYNGWIGNTGSNNNATLDGMKVGSTYDITATLDVTDHSLTMSKTFVKGEVSFDLQGHGSAISKLTNVAAGSKISAPSEPSAEGYTFGGWFTDAECTDEWTFASDVVEETMTLYAKWTANVYTITKTFSNVANAGLPASFTYTGATTTALNSTFTVDATNFFLPSSIAVTMGGTPLTAGTHYTYNNSTGAFTFSAVITGNVVITATATAKLLSIAITTQPTTRKYFAGESFSSTGAVVTATMGNGTKTVTATWTPSGALSAGTSQTVTASYTENGITKTATTTIDVYAVTMQATDENGDAIAVGGPSAPTRSIKSISPAADAANYVFKQWTISGASLGSSATTKSNTITSPTGAVTVTAVYYKPRVIKWSVNGDDSYDEGSPTLTVAYNGTITTVPSDPSGLACASTFVAWTDAAHNNGQTAKDDDSYYESKLFTDAGDFPNITAETTTFYAVFAEGGGAAVNTVMWSEDWTGATSSSGSGTPSPSDARPSAQGDHSGKTVYGGATITYTDGTGTYVRTNENNAGGTAPELLIKANENWTISGIPTGGAATLTLEYRTNGTLTVSTSTDNVSIGTKSGSNPYTNTITVGSGVTSFNLSFTQTSNRRIDNVSVKVASVSLTNYVTECDANIVKVTYDANGGATSCTNTTTDKTEDFTVCSSAPTRDYYTFAGWLCSADSKTYAASATISAAAIDADFTLTAQWTPVTYNITYELYGGTNSGSNPATYNVTTATITLQDPTKGHDRFDGWYDNGSFTGDPITSIPLGSHGNITLYAQWVTRHGIIFDADGVTTTIYRADDEDLSASVAGQGSVPSDPSAPTACSSKVFVGWSESTIDDETDDEPADLMKPAAGTVDEDKHYYAVWADEHSESGTVTVFNDAFQSVTNNSDYQDNKASSDKYTTYKVYGTGTAGEARMSASSYAGSIDIDLSDKTLASTLTVTFKLKRYSTEIGTVTLSCEDDGSTASFGSSPFSYPTGDDNWHDYSSTVTSVNAATQSIHFTSTSGKRVYIKDIVIKQTGTIYSYDKYATSCCATKVNLTHNSPEHGTITFGKTKIGTCDEDKEVSLTITPAAGYQLTGWTVNTASGYADAKSTSPAVATNNNSNAAQNITLTFAEGAADDYDVTATFGLMTVSSWAWTMHDGGGAIPNPLELYIGQRARLDVAYTPAGVDASKKTYTRTKVDAYINWVGALQATYSTIEGRTSTGESTTAVTFTHADGPTTTVNVKVLPLPKVHFVDNVHNESFSDVVATLTDNALTDGGVAQTPTHEDFTGSTLNSCEEQHLHLVGWIDGDWTPYKAYMNGTGAKPDEATIMGATGYFYAPGADIDLVAKDGKTYYAVWAKVE